MVTHLLPSISDKNGEIIKEQSNRRGMLRSHFDNVFKNNPINVLTVTSALDATYFFHWHQHKYVLYFSVWWLAMCFPLEKQKAGSQKILGWAARLHSPQILCSQFLRVRRLFSRLRAQRRVASAATVISSLSSTRLVHGRFPRPSKHWKVDRRPRCALGHSAESNSDFVSQFFLLFFFVVSPDDC